MWSWILLAVSTVIAVATRPKPQNAPRTQFGDLQIPNSQEGQPIWVIWGTPYVKAPSVAGYWNLRLEAISKGGGKK